jgi:hypothetical protein
MERLDLSALVSRRALVPALLGTAFALLVLCTSASAHEHVTVGEYELIVGWSSEPSIVGVPNGLDLGVEHHLANNTTEWVTGLQEALNATITTGTHSALRSLEPQFGRDGWYTFNVIPTQEGPYSFRIAGDINGTAVNVSVDVEAVVPRSDLEFPFPQPTPADLQQNASAQQAQIDALRAQVAALSNTSSSAALAQLQSDNAAVKAQAGSALLAAIGGAVLGAAGLGLAAWTMRKGRGNP